MQLLELKCCVESKSVIHFSIVFKSLESYYFDGLASVITSMIIAYFYYLFFKQFKELCSIASYDFGFNFHPFKLYLDSNSPFLLYICAFISIPYCLFDLYFVWNDRTSWRFEKFNKAWSECMFKIRWVHNALPRWFRFFNRLLYCF